MGKQTAGAAGAMSKDNRSPLDQFKSRASFVEDQFKTNLQTGEADPLAASVKALHDVGVDATKAMVENLNIAANHSGGIRDDAVRAALEYQKIAIAMQEAANALDVGQRMANGTLGRHLVAASNFQKSDASLTADLGQQAIGAETALRMRELALKVSAVTDTFNATREATLQMGEQILKTKNDLDARAVLLTLDDRFNATGEAAVAMGEQVRKTKNDLDVRAIMAHLNDGFNAAKTAAVQFSEALRKSGNDFSLAIADFKTQWGAASITAHAPGMPTIQIPTGGSNIWASAAAGFHSALAPIIASFTPMGLAVQAIGKIMQGLQPVLDAVMQPLVVLGQIIGDILIPVLHPLFEVLKVFGIAAALVGEVLYSVAGGIAEAIGGLIRAIGQFISNIPFLGGVGHGIKNFGQSIIDMGQGMFETAATLDTARRQLQDMGFNALANATNAATSAMLNVPNGFKVAFAQYQVQNARTGWAPAGAGASGASTSTTIIVNLDGKVVARSTLSNLRTAAQRTYGDSTRWPELLVV
jgi:hypothetical protein